MSAHPNPAPVAVRALMPADLEEVVAIDAAIEGRKRRDYIERRLHAARREPALHAQFAAVDSQGLAGFLLARMLHGEFGRSQPALRIEHVGVRQALRGRGVGGQLFGALTAWGARHGARELHTAADWRRADILHWFDRMGFGLAPHHVVESAVEGGAINPDRDGPVALEAGAGPAHEIDYGRKESNDHERLARDRVDVRSMNVADLDAIVRIDRDITGHDRRDYIAGRLAEAMDDASIRVSLTARHEDAVVGYMMARADLGDFGRTEPVAVIDTLGVDPAYTHRGIGQGLLSQLFANLGALGVERVETVVPQRDLDLLGFLYSTGFGASPRLVFTRTLEPA
ncbi:MAG: GNAT family N-acetyltransferase [Burkholderiales bacterium]|nr:GNAT family N-acetyltransferase [Burkholderiales bacterium]